MEHTIIQILIPATIAFTIGILITPILTHFLYKHSAWKKEGGKKAIGGKDAVEFNKLKGDAETKTPRMGGVIIWGSVLCTVLLFYILDYLFPDTKLAQLNFFSREQTWIPLTTMIIGAGIGFINDFYDIVHNGKGITISKHHKH